MAHQDRHGGYLNVGDIVLYGKFKNAKGKIIGFGTNEKGDPTIEVQPLDKDGQPKKGQTKTLTLLKVRKMTKEASAHQVVDIFLRKAASGIPLGKTWENGKVRVHRFSNSFKVWDLTNAGKRGKKVRVMHLLTTTYSMVEEADLLEHNSKYVVLNASGGYDSIKRYFEDVDGFRIEESAERGIDVRPGDIRKIEKRWKVGENELDMTATNLEFQVTSSIPLKSKATGKVHARQDTSYWSSDKKSAAIFYAWLMENETSVTKMDIHALRDLWSKLRVKYDYH